ncbi:MAG: YqjK-like family protein [Gallionella sp.]|nr:YqjK-like family protein [Gallionella sp.]
MNKKLTRIAERRERLIAQSAAQRIALAKDIELWRVPLARVDQGLTALRFVKKHPATLVVGGVLFAALRLHRAGKWLQLSWVTWQMRPISHSK